MGTAIHLVFITGPILANPIENHNKQIIRSTLSHLITSVLYPIVFITGSSLYYATKFLTQPIPDDMGIRPESRKYVWEKFIKQMFIKNRRSWSILTVINVIAAFTLTTMQSQQTQQLFCQEHKKYRDAQMEQTIGTQFE